MGLFERFATQGVYFQVFMIAFGLLVVLRAPFQKNLSVSRYEKRPPGPVGYFEWTRHAFIVEADGSPLARLSSSSL